MKKIASLSLLAAAVALSACGKKPEAPAAGAAATTTPANGDLVVRIGHASPLTGPQAHLGKDNENGAKMAIEDLNAKGIKIDGKPVKFVLQLEDDGSDPKQGTAVAQKLVDAKVNGVIGHLNSGTTIPASRIYNDAGIVEISPSATNPKYTQQGYKGAFRVMANDVQQGKVLGEFAVKDMAAKKIAIIDDRTAYGQGVADEFVKAAKKAGPNVEFTKEFTNEAKGDQIICERHIWNDADGGATMVVWSRKAVKLPDGRNNTVRMSHLMRSTDEGKTWTYFSTIGPGGEPAVCRLSATEQTAVIRGDRNSRMKQMFSHDAGKTWTKPVELEVGRVLPDLVLMSNGVLACSYGRPASCLMFSLDGGQTWPVHHVISEKVGFNYTSIREISPGKLLYIHDAPKVNAMMIEVERAK